MGAFQKIVLILGIIILSTSCTHTYISNSNQLVTSADTPMPTPTTLLADALEDVEVMVNSIEIVFLESFPLQVHAVVKGQLPDGCTTIQDIDSTQDESFFQIQISTNRPVDANCIQALVSFEQSVPLDVYGLPAGTYQVAAGEVEAEFTFTQENILSGGD